MLRRIALLLAAAPAAAAADPGYFDLNLEELSRLKITTAAAFPEDFLGASSSISLLSEAQWRERGARSTAEAIASLPSMMTYSSLGAHAIAIRGFSQSSSVRGIATLLDGVPLNGYTFGSALYARLNWDLSSLQRMEVIRGPSSALYGSDAFHGVIALHSFAPGEDQQRVDARLGSDRAWHTAWRGSRGDDSGWRLDASAGATERPGEGRHYRYTDPATGLPGGGEFDYRHNRQSAIARLSTPDTGSGRYQLGLYGQQFRADDHPGVGQAFSPFESRARDADHADSDTFVQMVRASGEWDLPGNAQLELLGFHWQSGLDTGLDLSRHPAIGAEQLTRTREQRQGLQLNLRQPLARHTDWLLAGSADRLHIDNRLTRLTAPDGEVLSERHEDSTGATRRILGLVNQFKTQLPDPRFTLVYGGRFDDFSDVGSKFTPRAGAIFQPAPRHALKLLYGRAFRAPTAVELYGIATALGNQNLQPETIDTWELVHMFEGEHWRSELVGFSSQWKNGIVLVSCASPACGGQALEYRNVAENASRGVEWNGEFELDAGWRLRHALGYTESFNDSAHGSTRYSAFPRWLAKLDVGYRWPSGLELYLANSLQRGASEGTGSATSDWGEAPLPAYWRTDLHLSRAITPNTTLSLDVRNLLDRADRQPAVWSNEGGLEDEGRTLTLGISVDF